MTSFEIQREAFCFYEAYITLAALAEMYPEAAKLAADFIRTRCDEHGDDAADIAFQNAVLTFLETRED